LTCSYSGPQPCPEWQSYTNNVNTKHCDGNGNGAVDISDLDALMINYDSTHTLIPPVFSDNPLQFRLEIVSWNNNGTVINTTYDLYVESALGGPVNVHGIACSIDFDYLLTNSVTVDFSNSTLLPDEHINIFNAAQNVLDIALTRTDKNNQLCDGALARINVVSDDIQGGNPVEFQFNNGKAISANGILMDILRPVYAGTLAERCTSGTMNARLAAIGGLHQIPSRNSSHLGIKRCTIYASQSGF